MDLDKLKDASFYTILANLLFFAFLYVRDVYFASVIAVLVTVLIYFARNPAHFEEFISRAKLFSKEKRTDRKADTLLSYLMWAYVAFLIITLYIYRVFLMPDQVLFFGVIGALFLKKGKKFLTDWSPFILLLFAYDAMRGIADNYGGAVHYLEPIAWEKQLFGSVLTIDWQHAFYVPGVVHWYDVLAIMFYLTHFIGPMFFAYFIWTKGELRTFKKFSTSFLITSYLALITFLLFPVAPPWLASEGDYLPPLQHLLFSISDDLRLRLMPTIYYLSNANAVAAVPSLHGGYPWILFLYAVIRYGAKGLPLFLYPLGMALSLVYLGEHYLVDILIGIAYASVVTAAVEFAYAKGVLN